MDTIIQVIWAGLVLAIALVRWRRESLAHDVAGMRAEADLLKARVADLETNAEASAQERETLLADNAKLRKRCARYARLNKRLKADVAALRAELDAIKARIDRSPSVASAPPAPES